MTDHPQPQVERLSRIDTPWSVLRRAHSNVALANEAQQQLLDRYGGAIRRYLLAAVLDRETANELFQEFALKFVRGDFKHVSAEKGRFRSFVKTVLYRMIALHFRDKGRLREQQLVVTTNGSLESIAPTAYSERKFFESWRDDLLAQTWQSLRQYEYAGGGPYYTVLQLKIAHPGIPTETFAELVSGKLNKPISVGSARILLHRSREKFAQLLIDVIGGTLGEVTNEAIEEELVDLQLIDYCREALAKRESKKQGESNGAAEGHTESG